MSRRLTLQQIIIKQIQTDEAMHGLVETMNESLELMQKAEPLRQSGHRQKVALSIARQIRECAHFISKYANTGGFRESMTLVGQNCSDRSPCLLAKRLFKGLGQNTADEIENYQNRLKQLVEYFNGHTTVDTNIVVLRVLESVGRLGQPLSRTCLHASADMVQTWN